MNPWMFLVLVLSFYPCSGNVQSQKCKPLEANPNVEVTCYSASAHNFRSSRRISSGCLDTLEIGSFASYKCKQFYVSLKQGGNEADLNLRCDKNGVWKGINKFNNFRCKEDCGNPIANVEPLVINGVQTYRSLHPWHAMIFVKIGNFREWTYLCGGSIIRNQVIVTAAHCVLTGADMYRVILGGVSTNYSKNSIHTGSQFYSVHRIYISENYDPKKGYQGDIAVFHLEDSIDYTEYISPVCLPEDYSADVAVMRNRVLGQIAGFGLTENGTVSETLRSIHLNIKSNSECYNSLHRVLSDSQFCAGSKAGETVKTVCNGDSGNGMTFLNPVDERFYLRGLVSSSDNDARKGVCQNLAIFTRIYPFVFWIRDVLEEISGENVRDLIGQNAPYPFVLHGNEVLFEVYKGLPREWENRVTKLDLRYIYVQFNDILSSLEFAKTITSIHISQAIVDGPAPHRRLVLPLLSQFHLDILRPDFELDDQRTFPTEITELFIKSHLFFDKDFNSRSDSFPNLLALKTDVDLVIHIFKLIHINATRGEVFLNQVGFSNKLFEEFASSDFKLNSLALRRTEFNISKITTASSLTSLILSQVELVGKVDLPFALSKFPMLKHLLLDPITDSDAKLEIGVDDFPSLLEFVSLSKSIRLVSINGRHLYDFRFLFPDQAFSTRREKSSQTVKLQNLKTLCCNMCELEQELLDNFKTIFPNISVLYLRTDQHVQIQSLLQIQSLKSLHLESSHLKNLSNFEGLVSRFGYPEMLSMEVPGFRLTRDLNSWKNQQVSAAESQRALFHCSAGKYFWTSEEEYRSKIRLNSFEKEAFKSKRFVFHGKSDSPDPFTPKTQFNGIPPQIQSDLKSIELKNVEVPIRVLSNSIDKATALKSMTLLNTDVSGNGRRYSFHTENLTLVLEAFQFVGFKFEYVDEFVNGEWVAGVVPFQNVGRFNTSTAANTLSRLYKNINSGRLEEKSVTLYSFDSTVAEVQAYASQIRKIVQYLPESHPLKSTFSNLKKIQVAYRHGILPPEWELPGLQIIDQNLVQRFYEDPVARLFGELGIMRYLVKRFGKFASLASLSLTDYSNLTKTFPPIQTMSLSLIRDRDMPVVT